MAGSQDAELNSVLNLVAVGLRKREGTKPCVRAPQNPETNSQKCWKMFTCSRKPSNSVRVLAD